ncbi:PHB depolymerase family esterase [Catenulispora subtropica]|uniref:PHB depolymerase family esterase n=1 Tax=Catenulispora subtropica TaxID=450798 RepID=A0ABN2SDI7_9ACTN
MLAFVILFTVAGCRAKSDASSDQSILVGGRTRTFHLYRPRDLPNPAPLVVMLHGGFGTGSQAEQYYGWDAEADRNHFAVLYPDGQNHAWNTGGGCCGDPGRQGTDDVAFITAAVRAVEAEVPIDPGRVYATGISNGGIMAYRLACDSDLFAAIGPDSATQLGPCPAPKPLSVLHIHGSADTRIRYNGGEGDGTAHIDGPPVPTVIADWRTTDACAPPTVAVSGPVTTSAAACADGRAVQLITIAGAGHQWPGSPRRPGLEALLGTDAPSTALDATDVFWQFFAAHPKGG